MHFTKYFKHYLSGKKFLVRTDHSSLQWLLSFKNRGGQMARWPEVLVSFDIVVEHRHGKKHANADALSRLPCIQCNHCNTPWLSDKESDILQINKIAESYRMDDVDLTSLQADNEEIGKVMKWIKVDDRPSYRDISRDSYFIRPLWSQWNRLTIQNGILYGGWDILGTDVANLQAVTPLTERRKDWRLCHDIRSSGHRGIKKTIGRVRQKCYWPCLQDDVRRYVNGCEQYVMRNNPLRKKQAPMQIVHTGIPMERIAADIMGELPETENGNKYTLFVSNYFTKWTESFAMANMEARTVAKIIVEEVIVRFGVPCFIHSD